jgi:hypothetical protein
VIPFANEPRFKKMARMVYEFDAADVGRSYIYPAMARSFREAGMQVAAHFAYDPTYMADVNTEYGTHYMNLAYAPQKALSLMIASEVFHEIPMYKNYGRYPQNTVFGNFSVDYEKDLAEMISDTKFLYTNHTSSKPPQADRLEKIAGSGNSSLIKYEGNGAYFLDRIKEGTWRLEVMPDAIWIKDPFTRTSPKKKIAVIEWKSWPMSIELADLGRNFSIRGMNEGNSKSAKATNRSFTISPGTYLLTKEGTEPDISPDDKWNNIILKEFFAPPPSLDKSFVLHEPATALAGKPYLINAWVAAADSVQSVQVVAWLEGFRPQVIEMKRVDGYHYQAELPADKIKPGFIRYHIVMKEKNLAYTYPSGLQTHPLDWDFFDTNPYQVPVTSADGPAILFHAATDADRLSRQWLRNSSLVPTNTPGISELQVNVEKLAIPDPENPNGPMIHDYSMRLFVGDKLSGTHPPEAGAEKIILRARSLNDKPCKIQVALVSKNGAAFGGTVTVLEETKDYEIPIKDLKAVKLVTLPRPYPTFLPYYFEGVESVATGDVEVLQLSIGPGIPEAELQQAHGIAIERITLEQ